MISTPDLALVSTADLITAVLGRFDHAIFHGRTDRPISVDDGHQIYAIRTKGETIKCIGMAYTVMSFAQRKMDERHQDIGDDEL